MLSIAAHNPGERDDLADYRESIQVRLQLTRKKFETHCIATHTHTHTSSFLVTNDVGREGEGWDE